MREYLLTLCIMAAVTYLLTGPVRKFAIVAGAMPEIRARDVHREPTPRLGGIAMFFGLCAGLLVADHLTNLSDVFARSDEPRALLSGAALIWLIGVLDDKFEIDALIKLGGQMIAAGVMVMQGLTILWLPVPGFGIVPLNQGQGTLLTVALVVITINAVNFVDGLDGLAAGMVCIAAAAFFMYAYRLGGYGIEAAAPATLFSAVLMGMCLGFLPHNMHPARIFMGDSGSMLIGLVLAAADLHHGAGRPGHPGPASDLRAQRRARDGSGLHPAADAADDHRDPGRRPDPRDRAPHLARPVAVRRRPRPSAPPAPGGRPLAQPGGADHVLLVGADRLRRARLLGQLGVHVDRPRHRLPQRGRPLAASAARFTPRAPRWAESFVPPRYRRRKAGAPEPRDWPRPTDDGERRLRRSRGGAPARAAGGLGSQRGDGRRRPFALRGWAQGRAWR